MRVPPHPESPDNRWAAGWPRFDFLELGALPTAAGSARGHVVNIMREWSMYQLTDSVSLVVSELIMNAVAATRAVEWSAEQPYVRLWMLGDLSRVLVLFWDCAMSKPELRAAADDDESGRGLAIVDALCARWDFYYPPEGHGGGKVVRALIDTP
jgi:hypothetical protein